MVGSLINSSGYESWLDCKKRCQQINQRLAFFASSLSGPVTIGFGQNMQASLAQDIATLTAFAALTNLNAAAVVIEQDNTFDAVSNINALITALQNTLNWVNANIPQTTFGTAATAPLLTLVQTAQSAV